MGPRPDIGAVPSARVNAYTLGSRPWATSLSTSPVRGPKPARQSRRSACARESGVASLRAGGAATGAAAPAGVDALDGPFGAGTHLAG